jgi:hypothetical protein
LTSGNPLDGHGEIDDTHAAPFVLGTERLVTIPGRASMTAGT